MECRWSLREMRIGKKAWTNVQFVKHTCKPVLGEQQCIHRGTKTHKHTATPCKSWMILNSTSLDRSGFFRVQFQWVFHSIPARSLASCWFSLPLGESHDAEHGGVAQRSEFVGPVIWSETGPGDEVVMAVGSGPVFHGHPRGGGTFRDSSKDCI